MSKYSLSLCRSFSRLALAFQLSLYW